MVAITNRLPITVSRLINPRIKETLKVKYKLTESFFVSKSKFQSVSFSKLKLLSLVRGSDSFRLNILDNSLTLIWQLSIKNTIVIKNSYKQKRIQSENKQFLQLLH